MVKIRQCAVCGENIPKKAIRCVKCKTPLEKKVMFHDPSSRTGLLDWPFATKERRKHSIPALLLATMTLTALLCAVTLTPERFGGQGATSASNKISRSTSPKITYRPKTKAMPLNLETVAVYGLAFGRAAACGVDFESEQKLVAKWIDNKSSKRERGLALTTLMSSLEQGAKEQRAGKTGDSCYEVKRQLRLFEYPI